MTGRITSWPTTVLCLMVLLSPGLVGSAGAQSAAIQVSPPVVEISSFYQGTEITMTGTIPAGHQAVAEVLGRVGEARLMRKGRWGPLWMNVGEMKFSGAPSLYLVQSSSPGLLTGDYHWGLDALIKRITVSGQVQADEKAKFQEQFLELKKSESLYVANPGGLVTSPAGDGRLKVTGKFWLPGNVKPDIYKVCLTAVLEGKAAGQQCTDLPVRMVGFPALLMSLAYQHAALYGIIAVVIAILTGFIMGYLFKGGGGH
jgi:hypothetical protein